MIYAFSVVWSWLLYGANLMEGVSASALPSALLSSIKWLLSAIGLNGGAYETALGGGSAVYSFSDFLALDGGVTAPQFASLLCGAITTMIVAWGTMHLLVKILTLRWR